MAQYVYQYSIVDAVQWTGRNFSELQDFVPRNVLHVNTVAGFNEIKTPFICYGEETTPVFIQHYVVRNSRNKYIVVAEDEFNNTYIPL